MSNKLFCVLYFFMWVIISINDTISSDKYPWYLPLLIAAFLGIPMWFSYQAGKENKD